MMVRRNPPSRFLSCFWLALLLPASGLAAGAAAPPSVVLITLDTTRADRLGAYGYTRGQTPHLDAFARQSVVFEQAVSPVPITLPAHCSLFTGTYPLFHGVRDFATSRLRPDLVTLAEIFRNHGYQTAAFISSEVLDSQFGVARGFQVYDEDLSYDPRNYGRERSAGEVAKAAVRWLQGVSGPFFLWVHFFDPHDPYRPPEPFASRFEDRPYDGEIAYMDQELGVLLKAIPEGSVVVVAGDHGESLGEHGEEYHGIFIYDATVRIPLLVRLPGAEPRRVPEQVRLIDVMPTLLQFLRWPIPEQVQGKSFLGLLLGRGRYEEEPAYLESFYSRIHLGWSELQGFRSQHYKFIRAPREEFYELGSDPGEEQNLRNSRQALALQYRTQLEQLVQKFSRSLAAGPEPGPALSSEQLEKLRSLGYVAFSPAARDVSQPGFDRPDPKDKIELFNQLTRALRVAQEDPSQSNEILTRILTEDPDIAVAHYTRGRNYMRLERYIQAAEAFRETLERIPDYTDAVYHLALCYAHMGRVEDARTGFERVLQLNPRHYKAYHQLAAAQLRRQQVDDAIRNLETAVEIEPRFSEGRNDLGRLYLYRGEYAKAIEQFQAAITTTPGYALAYWNLGRTLLQIGEKEKARQAFERARRLNPQLQIPEIP